MAGHKPVKAKVFEVMLHKLPSGKSPASALEEQLNSFLALYPDLHVVATHNEHRGCPRRTQRHAEFGRINHHHSLHGLLHRLENATTGIAQGTTRSRAVVHVMEPK